MEPGLLTAYLAMGAMAVVPIYFGSYASLKRLPKPTQQKDPEHDYTSSDEEESEALSKEDAYWFPVIGSGVLFSLYLVFRFLNKEYVNYLVTAYFSMIGVAALTKTMESSVRGLTGWRERGYHFKLTKKAKELFNARFTHLHLVSAAVSLVGTAYYVWTKNWIVSNLFGLAFATSAVQLIALDSFNTGMILLAGLFFYDIFWVFGTEVMVSVAKNFDAPIKVVFPKDLWAEKLQFTMLGLGDIVIPGIFVALCLRFDQWRRMKDGGAKTMASKLDFAKPYFTSCFIAYSLGLVTTVVVMHNFQAAQPALLYLSPACILSVLITAAARGELGAVFSYQAEDGSKKDEPTEAAGDATAESTAVDAKTAKSRRRAE